VKKGKNLVAWE